MNCKEVLTAVMKEAKINQTMLAKLTGMRGQTNVCEALKRDMKISLVVRFAEAMGYEVVIQKKKQGARKADQYVIDGGDSE